MKNQAKEAAQPKRHRKPFLGRYLANGRLNLDLAKRYLPAFVTATLLALPLTAAGQGHTVQAQAIQDHALDHAGLAQSATFREGTYEAAVGHFLSMSGASEEGQYCMGVMYSGPVEQGIGPAAGDGRPMTWFLCAAEGSAPPFSQEFARFEGAFPSADRARDLYQPAALHTLAPQNRTVQRFTKATSPSSVPLHDIAVEDDASGGDLTGRLILLPADLALKGLQALSSTLGAASLANKIGNIRFGGNDIILGFLAAFSWIAVLFGALKLRRLG
ncbi:MAG: hypothetical protein AAF530_17490 [Pseudomonadota bacterium]